MARINLLPWRQEVRERKNKEFMTLVVAVLLLSLLAAFAAWSYFNNQLTDQQAANEKIKQENTNLDKALVEIETLEQQRDDIVARMKVIQDLQGRRPVPVRVWDDIARVIQPQMYLTNMKREGDLITFAGQAADNTVVANFIRALDSSEWLQDSAVVSIQQPNAVAYQQAPRLPQTANGKSRPTYPEDSYITFVVTTRISQSNPASNASATASTPDATALSDTIVAEPVSNNASVAIASTSQPASVAATTELASSTTVNNSTASSASTAKE
ncbi:type IV pilus biogenesis fimbrial assembly [Moraxella macacae 0408225]|uniref:Type IV pilus biogenesis fimbrial assembly n=1 Tax=Moraxella macacae 0408225 TaxID=1230338 RepID=L2F949_9GAMM|nr:PilN domain-containing protein [Moraxella macacae]ELA09440.1 type IV pilus biogenesis fimbrial assembly [Moraxella macacae 0408225]